MQQLAADFAGLSQALWMQNLPQVQRHAEAIAEHPHVAPEEMQRIQNILGGEMARFVSYDEQVHDAAIRLAMAAAQGDTDQVLSELNEVQRGCVACHTEFRARLLSN
jgi:cytochrome c556